MRPTAKTCLVAHRGCLDGTGSAFVFLEQGGSRDNVVFRNPTGLVMRREELPADVDEVWYADCCPTDLTDPAGGLPFRVFDHHVSNARKFSGDPRCVFDMSRSGTSLMAQQLGHPMGRLEFALESYDLGRFDNVDGEFLADLAATFSQDEMLDLLWNGGVAVFKNAECVGRANGASSMRRLYADAVMRSGVRFDDVPNGLGGTMRAGVAASPVYWKNEVANRILASGKADVAVIIDPTGGMVSFRANPVAPDVSRVAELYGGGGHARASGFKAKSWDMLKALLQEVLG